MNHGVAHLVWMGIIFAVLLVVGKFVGVGLIVLFVVACLFMMAAMMLGMNHNDTDHTQPKDKE